MLCLTGDVMTGRGVDQILSAAGDPRLWERYVDDARTYVDLAEKASGPIPAPVDPGWPWGDALQVMDQVDPDLRIINLETSITTSDDTAPGKAVHYRMHPGNIGCLTAARPDACALANNHVLDLGVRGIEETLDALAGAGLPTAGAGRDKEEAWRPLELSAGDRRVLVWSVGAACSGVAQPGGRPRPAGSGVRRRPVTGRCRGPLRPRAPYKATGRYRGRDHPLGLELGIRRPARPGPLRPLAGRQRGGRRPRALVAPPPSGRGLPRQLVLYGCGDLVNDYEGISGDERYRPDLRLLYFVYLDGSGRLDRVTMAPLQARQMRLWHAIEPDAQWLRRALNKASRRFGWRHRPGARRHPGRSRGTASERYRLVLSCVFGTGGRRWVVGAGRSERRGRGGGARSRGVRRHAGRSCRHRDHGIRWWCAKGGGDVAPISAST